MGPCRSLTERVLGNGVCLASYWLRLVAPLLLLSRVSVIPSVFTISTDSAGGGMRLQADVSSVVGKNQTDSETRCLAAAGITATMMIISFAGPNSLLRLENASLDARFIMRGPIRPIRLSCWWRSMKRACKRLGDGRGPCDIQARVIDGIGQDHPKVIGLDIIYAEPESSAARLVLEDLLAAVNGSVVSPQLRARLQGKLNQFDTDRRLADSIASAGTVVLAMPFVVPETGTSANPVGAVEDYVKAGAFALVRNTRSGEAMEPYHASDVRPPLKPFAQHAIGVVYVYSLPDPDGITRYEYMAVRHGDDYYPSLALEIARVFLDVPRERVALRLGQGVQLGDRLIPTDQKGRMLINYLGRERQFRYVSRGRCAASSGAGRHLSRQHCAGRHQCARHL